MRQRDAWVVEDVVHHGRLAISELARDLLRATVEPIVVQQRTDGPGDRPCRLVGHASIRTTFDLYGQLDTRDVADELAAMQS